MTRLALTGARLLDGNRPAVENATVVVDGDRIAEVGTGGPAGQVDRMVDLGGRTLMPGMFTCHFHATYHELGSKPNVPYGDEYPPAYLALIAAKNYRTALEQGYTGVVGAGGSHHIEPGVKRAIRRRTDSGTAGRGLRPASCRLPGTATTPCPGTGECRPRARFGSATVPTPSVSASGKRSSEGRR